jgi:cell division protease FtsH
LRQLLTMLGTEDNPPDSRPALDHFRKASLGTQLSVSPISLNDIAGYQSIKQRLRDDFLSMLELQDTTSDPVELSRLETIIPRGIVLSGPSGVGKTMFAHALSHGLGAALLVTTGPELKSRFLGGSEENIRHLFFRARQSAPSIILFEEIDNFASIRETKNSTGVEASMLIQLLAELDRLRPEESVFIIGTTQRKEAIDNSLLRPGRLELVVEIPLPNADDRKAILEWYDQQFDLQMDRMAIKKAVSLSEGNNTSGERLAAICRSLARMRVRHQRTDSTTIPDVEFVFETN